MPVLTAVSVTAGSGGSPAESPPADLVWPGDPRALAISRLEGASASRASGISSWPRSAGEICPAGADSAEAGSGDARSDLRRACREAAARPVLSLTLNAGAYSLGKIGPLGVPFETFQPGWGSVRTDPELARAWTEVPAAADVELRYPLSPRAFVYFRMGLRRDLAAWWEDDLALNLPLSTKEVDLNEPSLGYFNWESGWLGFTVGRIPVHWSPSREFGLMLSDAVPYHDAVQAVLKGSRVRYLFLVSSLNPWLEGTPAGNSSSEEYPVGSEQWRQRHYPVLPGSENAHKRVYDAPMKTLVAHRLEGWAGPLTLGITESNIVGGKPPDLRDMNPFAIFHNDFHEGYSNNNVSLDAALRLPMGFSLAAELFMDDLEWSETEGAGATPSLLGYLAGLRHAFRAGGWTVSQSAHAIRTDPYLYGFLQPLNTYASRHVLTSNFQHDRDPVFVDKYVVDYPIGYLRGGDALDFWYAAEARRGGTWGRLDLAALSRGEAAGSEPFEGYYLPHGSSPSGREERETRIALSGGFRGRRGSLLAGLGWSGIRDADNRPGEDRSEFLFSLGAGWSIPR